MTELKDKENKYVARFSNKIIGKGSLKNFKDGVTYFKQNPCKNLQF
jgi:hypothetical protein